jgi:hypothetical protein
MRERLTHADLHERQLMRVAVIVSAMPHLDIRRISRERHGEA